MADNIANVIHQTHFEYAHQKILIGLMVINNRMVERQTSILKPFDITLQQYNVLRILRGQYPKKCTLNVIRDRMIDRMSDVSRIVERLRQNGLLTRVPKVKDRRAVDILISEKGLTLLKEIDALIDYFYEPIIQMQEDEKTQMSELLDKLLSHILETE